MPSFTRSVYTFGVNDKNNISLLTHYCGHLPVGDLQPNFGVSLSNKTIDDLPVLIEQIKAKGPKDDQPHTLRLTTDHPCSSSLLRVFPKPRPQNDVILNPTLEATIDAVYEHISWRIAYQYLQLHNNASPKGRIIAPPKLKPLTQKEANEVIYRVYQRLPSVSAIELPSYSCIIIADEYDTFILYYGTNTSMQYMEDPLIFDLDDGFFRRHLDITQRKYYYADGPQDLKEVFKKWEQGNRTDYIFQPSKGQTEGLSKEIHQCTPLIPPDLAKIIAEYAYTPISIRPKIESPVYLRNLLIPFIPLTVTTTGVIAGAFFIGFSLPIILLTSTAMLAMMYAGVKLIQALIKIHASRKVYDLFKNVILDTPSNACRDKHAFEAGVAAGKSYRGYFNAWALKDSYSNYDAYTAGKYLAQKGDENMINLIEIKQKKLIKLKAGT